MEIKQIEQLMRAMVRIGMKKLQFKKGNVELYLEKEEAFSPNQSEKPAENPLRSDFQKHAVSPVHELPAINDDEVSVFITSPMVGTFYASASPKDRPYITVGSHVEKNQVVCIVEAMKVMNEIKSQESGTIAEILIENGAPVEFGTKLFRVTV